MLQMHKCRELELSESEKYHSFLHSDINDEFLSEIETGWTAEFQGDEYWLYNPREDKHGNKSFEGLLDFVRQGNKIWHIDDAENKSMTIQNSIGPLIDAMPNYTLNIIDNFYANTMSYSNRQTTTERFYISLVGMMRSLIFQSEAKQFESSIKSGRIAMIC
ncbi:hypothetical protein [Jeotgalicoccus sp. WY2]|uniref:hypothetical protein n=1 Tax=Jeotgalicoccus sp. WY2 TaxID=2708346 RepID=UPI001BD592E3|nr:hypothetical protein [Jeotgalicoccus sp. WY2]